MPVSNVAHAVKARTCKSSPAASFKPSGVPDTKNVRTREAIMATAIPALPPSPANKRLSARNCRIKRARAAPIERRIAS